MKAKYIFKGIVVSLLVTILATSCENYNEPLLTDLGNTRSFSPVDLTAKIRNRTTVELDWMTRPEDDHYVIEFAADDTEFATIFKTVEVTADQLPIQVELEGETLYSIRVKAVTSGLEQSRWTVVTANTLSEQLFLSVEDGDIASKEATLRWVAGSNVTQIVLTPGNITHVISAEEKAAGIAILTGLNPETSYQANLFNNTKKRGATTFQTGIDIGDGILIKNTDDLIQAIETATSGAKLFLEPGDYKTVLNDGTKVTEIILNKSITISGIPGKAKPVLFYKLTANSGTTNVNLLDLILNGSGIDNASVVTINGGSSNYGDILLSGCEIQEYNRALFSAGTSATGSKIASFIVDNCKLTNVNTNAGADFIDVRNAYIASVMLKNSTFNSCSNTRDFIRIDAAAGLSGTGLSTNIVIDGCTLNNVSNSTVAAGVAGKRILYVRFVSNASVVRNTLIANTTAVYNNSTVTNLPTFSNNNYFNALNFKDSAIKDNRVDATGTTIDPGFTNATTGDFTISNQTLKDNNIGDPRWIK